MKFLAKNKLLLFIVAYLLIVLVAVPLTIISLRQKQPEETRTNASASTTLSLLPSTATKNTGENAVFDIQVNPGQNVVSIITLDVLFDATKFSADPTNAFAANTQIFPTVLEGPVYTPGRIRAKISTGFDPTKAITTVQKAATISLKALAPTNNNPTTISFGESSLVLSIGPNDTATGNVLANTLPAQVTINGDALPTPTGNGVGGPGTSVVPTFQTQPTTPITLVPTNSGPTCTPLPPECLENEEEAICNKPPAGGYCHGPTSIPTQAGRPTPTPIACRKLDPVDTVLVVDTSVSMSGDKLANIKQSAIAFIDLLKNDPTNRIALVKFDKTSELLAGLANAANPDHVSLLKRELNALGLEAGTCIKCGIDEADNLLREDGRENAQKIVILLTDGRSDRPNQGGSTEDKVRASEQAALNAVRNRRSDWTLYTIGVGTNVNSPFLQEMATTTGGLYYYAQSPIQINEQFNAIYKKIADALCSLPDAQITTIPGNPTLPPLIKGGLDPVTLVLILLLILPLLLLIGHLLV